MTILRTCRHPYRGLFTILLSAFVLMMAGDAFSHYTARVSADSSGKQGNYDSFFSSVSADGRYVAFESDASNLVAGDTNSATDIFVHDRQTGETTRVSIDSSGNQANSGSHLPAISADGRVIVFASYASNLVAGDTNNTTDIFVHDRQTGETTRVSIDSSGNQANSVSIDPSISADGRYVAFPSVASNLVAGDTNNTTDVFVHDRQTGETTRVSVDSAGNQANTDRTAIHGGVSISADGRYVAFDSHAGNLVAGDTNGRSDVFVHDRQAGETTRVSVSSWGKQGDKHSDYPSISVDGRYIAFQSHAGNLVKGDKNGCSDVFVHDRQTGETTRVSIDSSGNQGDKHSDYPSISADGRYVAFQSHAGNLVKGDKNGCSDVFVRDLQTGETTRASVDTSGKQGNDWSAFPAISADGRCVSFGSMAGNLVAHDSNHKGDIFISYPPVTILAPNGGEFIPSGSTYTLGWEAIAKAETFKLKYSLDSGITWIPIIGANGIQGTSFGWIVPNAVKNREHCLVRVIGYTGSGDKVGKDDSDATFTIGVVNLTAPSVPGISVTSGHTYDIAWTTQTASPIETITIYYTTDAKSVPLKWELITAISGGVNPGTYSWTAPMVTNAKTKCKIKVVLKNAFGKTIGVDRSDNYFVIQPPL